MILVNGAGYANRARHANSYTDRDLAEKQVALRGIARASRVEVGARRGRPRARRLQTRAELPQRGQLAADVLAVRAQLRRRLRAGEKAVANIFKYQPISA